MNETELAYHIRDNPEFHIEHIQGETIQSHQKRVIHALRNYDRITVPSCHDMGKSWTAAKAVLWFTSTHVNSKVITTAPTFNQVKRILWSEIRAGHEKSKRPLGGDMLTTEWKLAPEWFAIGFTTKVDADGTGASFQGFHAPYVLIVFDEATGIANQIWEQAEGMLTSANVKIVALGNPTSKSSKFFSACESPFWKTVRLTCFDSPNLIANGITDKEKLQTEVNLCRELSSESLMDRVQNYKVTVPYLLTLKWVIELALEVGIDHPLFISRALGEFPDDDDYALFKLAMIERAQNKYLESDRPDQGYRPKIRYIGVDPARYGSDNSVITIIEDDRVTDRIVLINKDTNEVAGRVISELKNRQPAKEFDGIAVDATGLGAGVFDNLSEAADKKIIKAKVKEVHFGESPDDEFDNQNKRAQDRDRYSNLKAKIFSLLVSDLDDTIQLIDDNIYLAELPTIRYDYDSRGRLKIESKDDYKKRTGKGSPDSSDSLAIANYCRHVKFEKPKPTPRISRL